MKGYVRLLRPGNCTMGIVASIIAALIIIGDIAELKLYYFEILLASVTVFAFTGAGNALNDYFDRKSDRINHPKRPIPSGRASPKGALWLSASLFVLAIIASVFINWHAVLIVMINLAFMLSYEVKLKRSGFAGNLEISWLTASLFIFGGFAVFEGIIEEMKPIWILAVLAFFATLGREISKDIQDVKGDVDRRTLPRRIGRRKAGYIAVSALLLGVVMSPLPYLLDIFTWRYLVIVALADATFIYSALILRKRPAKASKGAKLAMYIALAAFLAGGLIR